MVFFNLTFNLLGIFWGIKEITLANKSDEKYARFYHTCGFALVMKVLIAVYFLYVFTGSFYDQNFITTFATVDIYVPSIPNFTSKLSAVLAVIMLILYLIPQISFLKAKRKFQEDKDYEDFMTEQGNVPPDQNSVPNEQYSEQNYQDDMQNQNYVDQNQGLYNQNYDANEQYYQGVNVQTQYQQNVVEPLNPQAFTQNPNRSGVSIIPGQNGVPYNITPKGIEDLARLERLRSSGAIDEQNYFAMRKKVCQINVSSN